jgi:zinc protease
MTIWPHRFVPIVLAATLIAPRLAAQALASPERPGVGALAITHPAGATHETFANGLTFVMLPFGTTPKTEIRVVFETTNDPASSAPLRTLLPVLWRAGSTRLTGDALADSLEQLGGTLSVSATPTGVALSLDLLSSALSAGLNIVSDIVQHPRIDATLLDRIAGRGRGGGRRGAGGANDGAVPTLENALFGASTRTAADSAAAPESVDELSRVYATHVLPTHTTVYLTGQFDKASAKRTVTTAFASWRRGTTEATKDAGRAAPLAREDGPPLIVIHRPGARQTSIVVGARVASPADSSFPHLRVVDALLGGSLVSRISMNVREAKGYVYSPASRLVALAPNSAYWAEVVEVAANVTWPTLREILREIAGIDSTPPTRAEVESSARFVIGSALMRRASRSGWADEVDENRSVGTPWGELDSGLRAALATTPAEVRSLVDRYLAPSKLTIVVEADTVALGRQMAEIRQASHAMRAKPR